MSDRALIVSAGNLLRRGFQAIATDRNAADGQPVNALYGVARSLHRALALKTPTIAVAVTSPISGPACPQSARLSSLIRAHGIVLAEVDDEAQVVAAYTRRAVDAGYDVVVVGADKRYAQLVAKGVWWFDPYKDARYTPAMVEKRFLVSPARVADWLALVGDDDALGGIKGIGKKSATTLLQTYGTIEDAIANLDALDTRTQNALRAATDTARSEAQRARLDANPALPVPLDAVAFQAPPDDDAINQLYVALQFFELLSSVPSDGPTPTICDTDDSLAAMLAIVQRATTDRPTGISILADDPSPARGGFVGLAAVAGSGERFYVPLKDRPVPATLTAWLNDPNQPKISHEVTAVLVALARRQTHLAGVVADSMCASHLVEPSNLAPHDLPVIARHVLRRGLATDDDVRGVGQGRKPWSAVADANAAAFACDAAAVSQDIWARLKSAVDAQRMQEYLALSETVARMSVRGIGVDVDALNRVGADFQAEEASLEKAIHGHARKTFNLASAKQLSAVLFEDLGLTVLKRTKTGWSTATDALERIQHEHPIVPLVVRWRALQRMRNTWVTSLKACVDDDGRVRSTFFVARSFSGRIINAQPDLGRVPGRTDDMQRIRRAFVAAPGHALLSVDYRQLGLFVLAHLSQDPALVEPLRRNEDMHVLTASAVLQIPAEDVTKDQRQLGKVVNFATFAGQGASALSRQLGVSPQEAKVLIERFDHRYEVVRTFQDEQLRLAREEGYIQTISGRRWPIGDLESLDPELRSYAERLARRATHEGSVADVSRRGLLHADQALRAAGLSAAPLLQIHDEVLFEVPVAQVQESARVAGEAMATAYALTVPLRVNRKAGRNWADLSPVEE